MDSYRIFIILLALIPAIISIGVFIYTFYFLERTNLILAFSFLTVTAAIWQISDVLIRFIDDFNNVTLLYHALFFGLLFVVPSSLHFSLLYTNKLNKYKTNLILTIIYLPSVIFYLATLLQLNEGDLVPSKLWRYIYARKGILDIVISSWIGIITILTMIILIKNCFNIDKNDKNKYKGAVLLAAGFSIPAILGILTQVIFPLIFHIKEIPLTTTFVTIFSVTTIFSLVKYKLFEYSPFSVIQQIFDSLQEGIMITDNKGIIKYSNKSFYSSYGYNKSNILNTPITELLANESDKPKIITHLNTIKTGKSSTLELLIKHTDKNTNTSLINSYPYFNSKNKIIGMLSLFVDISELKAREKQLETSEAKLSQSQKIAKVGFILLDLKTDTVETSIITNKLFGLPDNKQKFNANLIRNAIHPNDKELVRNSFKDTVNQVPTYSIEHRIINYNTNKEIWIKGKAKCFYNEDGTPNQVFITIIDITKNKLYEKNMLIAMIEGEEKEKTRIAQELHDGIAQYMAAINMSLNSIKEEIPEEVKSYFNKTQELVLQAITETRNISHNLLPKEIEYGLESALNSIIEKHDKTNSFKINCNFKGLKNKKVSQFVKFNLYRITQEFYNNTYKYANAKNLNINISTNNKQLTFIITDDGVGFDINSPVSTGIGLKNMSQRAKAIGSTFNFTSQPKQGTRLEITIQLKNEFLN